MTGIEDEKLKLVENFVLRSFKKINNERRAKYFSRTLHWASVLKPNASSALKIAALGYDIEKAFRNSSFQLMGPAPCAGEEGEDYSFKKSAEIMKKFLVSNDFPPKIADKVYSIIAGFPKGNEPEHKILRDADRINYFENIAIRRSRAAGLISPERIKTEFERKFSEIATRKAREIAEPFYKKALHELMKK